MKMAHVILAHYNGGCSGFSSCKTNSERVVPPGLREQVRAGSGELAYIRPGEQLYFFDITIDSEIEIDNFIHAERHGEWRMAEDYL